MNICIIYFQQSQLDEAKAEGADDTVIWTSGMLFKDSLLLYSNILNIYFQRRLKYYLDLFKTCYLVSVISRKIKGLPSLSEAQTAEPYGKRLL